MLMEESLQLLMSEVSPKVLDLISTKSQDQEKMEESRRKISNNMETKNLLLNQNSNLQKDRHLQLDLNLLPLQFHKSQRYQ